MYITELSYTHIYSLCLLLVWYEPEQHITQINDCRFFGIEKYEECMVVDEKYILQESSGSTGALGGVPMINVRLRSWNMKKSLCSLGEREYRLEDDMRMQQIQTHFLFYTTVAIIPQRKEIFLSSSSSNGYFSMTEVLDWKTSRKSKENWENVRAIWIRLFSYNPTTKNVCKTTRY